MGIKSKTSKAVFICLFLILFASLSLAQTDAKNSFRIQRLSDRVIALAENSPMENIIVAAASGKGLIAVGTLGSTPLNKNEPRNPIKFTILYDNYLYKEGTKTDWGFSCLIEGTEKTILFDTGTQPDILMHNVQQLNVNLNRIELIVISHIHHDHTGGLSTVLDKNHDVTVYLPISFPSEFVQDVEKSKAKVVSVDNPVEICQDVYLTGEMGEQIKEQSLIINTKKGLVIVTGCSHQGIVNILKRAKEMLDKPIYLVFGGFHLGAKQDSELQEILQSFKELGVLNCGATHCTGERAIALFKKAYGDNYLSMGTGRILIIPNEEI